MIGDRVLAEIAVQRAIAAVVIVVDIPLYWSIAAEELRRVPLPRSTQNAELLPVVPSPNLPDEVDGRRTSPAEAPPSAVPGSTFWTL